MKIFKKFFDEAEAVALSGKLVDRSVINSCLSIQKLVQEKWEQEFEKEGARVKSWYPVMLFSAMYTAGYLQGRREERRRKNGTLQVKNR
jgi:hypothetical protein